MPIVVRLFDPISFIFPEASASMPLGATVPLPICVLCEGLASPPSRLGWAQTPDRQMIFACCGACADCPDQELEERIRAKFSASRASTDGDAPATLAAVNPIRQIQPPWTVRAAAAGPPRDPPPTAA